MFDSAAKGVTQGFAGSHSIDDELGGCVPEPAAESSLALSLAEGDGDDPSGSVVQEWVFDA